MGACAGWTGPNRRSQNYRVNRLSENSPIKSRLSPSQLPQRPKQRIIEEISQSKRKNDNNLITSILTSSIQFGTKSNVNGNINEMNPSNIISARRASNNFMSIREDFETGMRESLRDTRRDHKGPIFNLRKTESILDMQAQNMLESKHISETRLGAADRSVCRFQPTRPNTILSEMRISNKNDEEISFTRKRMLTNIPELPEEDSKTPMYIKQIKKRNGEDVKIGRLQFIPVALASIPNIPINKYLKDLV